MGNSTRRFDLGDVIYVTMGDWAGHYGVVRDVYRGYAKVAIKDSIVVTPIPLKSIAFPENIQKKGGKNG